jgi:hypothetical protein
MVVLAVAVVQVGVGAPRARSLPELVHQAGAAAANCRLVRDDRHARVTDDPHRRRRPVHSPSTPTGIACRIAPGGDPVPSVAALRAALDTGT